MKSQRHPGAPGAVSQGSTCDTRRWRDADRAGAVGRRDDVIRALAKLGWPRRAIAALLGVSLAVVVRAREGGAS